MRYGPFYKIRIHDRPQLLKVLKNEKIAATIHLAAFALIEESIQSPDLYYENNVLGSEVLLSCLAEAGVAPLVFSSSCAVYGESLTPQINEDHPRHPINPYGLSKKLTEDHILELWQKGQINPILLRYFNAAGSDPEGELGEEHTPETHILPNLIRAALNNQPVKIYGQNYATPDGTCVRDFIHVCDLAAAHVIALKSLLEGKEPVLRVFNLGSMKGYSLLELVKEVSLRTGKDIKIQWHPPRAGDPARLVADSRRFQSQFHQLKPIYELKDMVLTASQWSQNNP